MKNLNNEHGQLKAYFPQMPDRQFSHMVKVNKVTIDKVNALMVGLERGKKLIESAKVNIENSRRILS